MNMIAEVLATLGQGIRPSADGLLGNCRLEWRGGEACGEEAILESFRMNRFDVAAGRMIADERGFAILDGNGGALFGDLYGGRIGRLWRVGPGEPPPAEPAITVAFDPDLSQERGDVLFRAADHPHLSSDLAPALLAAARGLVEAERSHGFHRVRAFIVRAFSVDGAAAALAAVYRLGGQPVRTSGFSYAVLMIESGGRILGALDPAISAASLSQS